MKLWIITAFMLFTGISMSAQMRFVGHVHHDRFDKVLEKQYRKHHKEYSKAMRDGFIDRNEARKLKRIEWDIYHLERNLKQRYGFRAVQHRRMHCQ